MRLNKYLAQNTALSRRGADDAIAEGRVEINGILAKLGDTVIESDKVTLDSHDLNADFKPITLILHKPVGYVCSRNGQGSKTVYDLLPSKYHHLNPVGRLDKDSSGLLLMTNEGELANRLTHPKYGKAKVYMVGLDRQLNQDDMAKLSHGVDIGDDRPSKLEIREQRAEGKQAKNPLYHIAMTEGRNRQIRRTFEALGYKVVNLHRTKFGNYSLKDLQAGDFIMVINIA